MRKSILALATASAFAMPAVAGAQSAPAASPHSFTGNISLVSNYKFRGINQTAGKPALQGGFDYAHTSGVYLGNWNSNVSEGAGFPAANLEMDFYGGWKKAFGDFGLDVGAIYYYYPGSDWNVARLGAPLTNPNNAAQTHTGGIDNKEIYLGGSWKWLSAKVFYSIDDYFSLPGTKGTYYLDTAATFDLGNGWGVVGHIGRLKSKGWYNAAIGDSTKLDYTDWKIGVTKDVNGWLFGVAYVGTNAKGSCDGTNPGFYCFGNVLPNSAGFAPQTPGVKFQDAGRDTLILSVSKTF